MTIQEAQNLIQQLQAQAVKVSEEFDQQIAGKDAVIIEQGNKITALETENAELKAMVEELENQVLAGTQVPAGFAGDLNGLAETMQVLDDKVPDASPLDVKDGMARPPAEIV